MTRHAYVFIGANRPIGDVAEMVGKALDGTLAPGPDGDLFLMLPSVAVNLGTHDFDDRDLENEDGEDIRLASEMPHLVEVRDLEQDYARQNATALRVLEAARAAGWRAVAVDDMVDLLGRSVPGGPDVAT